MKRMHDVWRRVDRSMANRLGGGYGRIYSRVERRVAPRVDSLVRWVSERVRRVL